MRRLFLVAISALLGTPAAASMGGEGIAPFAFSAWFLDAPTPGHVGRLRILVDGTYRDSARIEARIHLPKGLTLTAGDTVMSVPGSADPDWVIGLAVEAPGQYEIRGELRAHDVVGPVDEGEWRLPIDVRADTTIVRSSIAVREEQVRGTQRYRYGGQYLVPIDGPEDVVEADIDLRVGKPKIVKSESAVDSLGEKAKTVVVPFVLIVDAEGNVRDARVLGGASQSDRVTVLARKALQRWRFEAAVTKKGRRVSDWVEVEVEVTGIR